MMMSNGGGAGPSTNPHHLYPTSASLAQPVVSSPYTAVISSNSNTNTPWAAASKPLPPKPEGGVGSASGSGFVEPIASGSGAGAGAGGFPFPEPHIQGQGSGPGRSQSPTQIAIQSQQGSLRGMPAPMPGNLIVDPHATPQESITIHGHGHGPGGSGNSSSRPAIPRALRGRRSASAGMTNSLHVSPTSLNARAQSPTHSMRHSQYQHQRSGSGSQFVAFPSSRGNANANDPLGGVGRSLTPSSARPPHAQSVSDTVLYPRTYNEATMSDSATAAHSTRTPRLRRASGRVLGSGSGGGFEADNVDA